MAPFSAPQTHAAAQWPDMIGNAYGSLVKTITETIKGIQLGAAKKAAMIALQKEMAHLITGKSSGGPMFVTDWRAYAIKQPTANTNIFINDYISQSLRGRGSLTGYASRTAEGIGRSYMNQLQQGALRITSDVLQPKVTFQGEPSRMFAGTNGFRQLNLYLSGVNNPWAFNLDVQANYQKKLAEEQLITQMKINGTGGILPKEVNGITVSPASLIEAQVAKVQTMGLDIMANANNLPEVIGGVVSSMINQAMVSGIGQIQAGVNREITNVRSQAIGQMNNAIRNVGPGAMYKR